MKIDQLRVPRKYNKRIKLTDCQKQEIKDLAGSISKHQLAKIYNVSRRLIQFIIHPERLEQCKALRKLRGGSAIYYNTNYNTIKKQQHRAYKRELINKGIITC